MKLLVILGLCFVAQAAYACPDFSGSYRLTLADMTQKMEITQIGCEAMIRDITYLDEAGREYSHLVRNLKLDGNFQTDELFSGMETKVQFDNCGHLNTEVRTTNNGFSSSTYAQWVLNAQNNLEVREMVYDSDLAQFVIKTTSIGIRY